MGAARSWKASGSLLDAAEDKAAAIALFGAPRRPPPAHAEWVEATLRLDGNALGAMVWSEGLRWAAVAERPATTVFLAANNTTIGDLRLETVTDLTAYGGFWPNAQGA